MLFAWIINTVVITIKTIKTITIPIYGNALSISGQPPHFALPLPPHLSSFSDPPPPPHFHQFWKSWIPTFMKGIEDFLNTSPCNYDFETRKKKKLPTLLVSSQDPYLRTGTKIVIGEENRHACPKFFVSLFISLSLAISWRVAISRKGNTPYIMGDIVTERSNRGNHQRCSMKTSVLRNFAKFTGKHLCKSLFFNKVAGLRPATLLK